MAKYMCNQYAVPEHLYPLEAKARALCDMALDVHNSTWSAPKHTTCFLNLSW